MVNTARSSWPVVAHRAGSLLVLWALAVTACASGSEPTGTTDASTTLPASVTTSTPPTAAPSTTAAESGFVVMAIGDSIPFNDLGDCAGCVGFVDSYAEALQAELGEPVTVVNRSRHDGARTVDILVQLGNDQTLLDQLATAGVVIVSVGANDQPPFADEYEGCPPPVRPTASEAEYIETAEEVTTECVDTALPVIRAQVAQVLSRVREVAPEAAIAVLLPYDWWRGYDPVESLDSATRDGLYGMWTHWYQGLNAALCEEAEAVEGTCIDAYHAFNGPRGTRPAAELLASDYSHPSQEGNDVIRDLLVDAALVGGS